MRNISERLIGEVHRPWSRREKRKGHAKYKIKRKQIEKGILATR